MPSLNYFTTLKCYAVKFCKNMKLHDIILLL